MTWHAITKLAQSGLTGSYTVPVSCTLLAQGASASATYEHGIWGGLPFTAQTGLRGPGSNIGDSTPYSGVTNLFVILGAYLITDTAVTGGAASTTAATATIRLYDSAGVSVGVLFSLTFSTGTDTVAYTPKSLGAASTTVRALGGGCAIRSTEALTFRWAQTATTGLALPAACIVLDIV